METKKVKNSQVSQQVNDADDVRALAKGSAGGTRKPKGSVKV